MRAKPRPVGRPSLSGEGRTSRVTVPLSPALTASAAQRADRLGISVAELIRRALAAFLA